MRRSCRAGSTSRPLTIIFSSRSAQTIQLDSTLVRDRNTIVGYRTALADITELKRAEVTLRLAVRMREDFLAIVSHDLRNPLNAILLTTYSLLLPGTSQIDPSDSIRRIDRAATRMTRMLADLLDLSSMDAGHLSMDRTVESVPDLLAAAVENRKASAAEKSIRLETALAAPNLVAYCDRGRISQVMANLVGNTPGRFSTRAAAMRASPTSPSC